MLYAVILSVNRRVREEKTGFATYYLSLKAVQLHARQKLGVRGNRKAVRVFQ